MYRIVFATNNEHKLREIRTIFGDNAEVLSLNDINCHVDIPETADTLEGNALIKARYIYNNFKMDCFADDTGLEVEALDGECIPPDMPPMVMTHRPTCASCSRK